MKPVKRRLVQSEQSQNASKQRRTLEDNCELDALVSIDDVEECTNSGVDVDSNTIPGNKIMPGRRHKTTVRKNSIQKLSVGGLIYNVSVGITCFTCYVLSCFKFFILRNKFVCVVEFLLFCSSML